MRKKNIDAGEGHLCADQLFAAAARFRITNIDAGEGRQLCADQLSAATAGVRITNIDAGEG